MIALTPFTEKDFGLFITWITHEELLITIAGNYFSYPLTTEQLHGYLKDDNSLAFNIVDNERVIGHAELYKTGLNIYKIDKLIIGDTDSRGKGLCFPVVKLLARYAFEELQANTIELNVFNWNAAAIKCYEKAGFMMNAGKTVLFEVGDKKWMALNMTIEK